MKKVNFIFAICLTAMFFFPSLWGGAGMGLFAQGVGINATGNPPDAKALLDVDATSMNPKAGLLVPRMTTTERDAIAPTASENSLLIFNTTTQCFEAWNAPSSTWVAFGCIGCQLPGAFTANAATNITATSFDANWTASAGATTYYLDVSTASDFSSFVSGYNNNNVGNVTTHTIATTLTCNTTYYYRVRAGNSCGTNSNSNTITVTTAACFTCGTSTVTFTYNGSSVTYGTVAHNSECWLDRNLGASQVATSSTDANAYGDLFQWGRLDDGHQIRTSGTTSTLSSTDNPGHSNFILAPNSPYDWRSPQNGNLWQGVSGTNNPCPSGYRLPTDAELDAERTSWSSNNAAGAYASPLKLPVAGYRSNSSGSLGSVGSNGYYWSSTVSGTGARFLVFYSSGAGMNSYNRADGFSVRCIKD